MHGKAGAQQQAISGSRSMEEYKSRQTSQRHHKEHGRPTTKG
jgi:hypothetical protein